MLDIACGNGYLLKNLLKFSKAQYHGIDLNMNIDASNFDSRISLLNNFLNPNNLWVMGFHQDHEEKTVVPQEDF